MTCVPERFTTLEKNKSPDLLQDPGAQGRPSEGGSLVFLTLEVCCFAT
jgi:hypothetical protein